MVKRKLITPNVVDGGIAIPLGNNYYYMKGRKHKDGGIDIGPNGKDGLEVEDGEIMKTSPKEVKVYSSVPFLNGRSPVEKLLGGENPTTVFRQQEEYKDRNGINDDGTRKGKRKAEMGILDNINQDTLDKYNNSLVATGIKLLDPTGITSWYDVKRAYDDYREGKPNASLNLAAEVIGAIPVIGKVGKAVKAMKAVRKISKGKVLTNTEKELYKYAIRNKKAVIRREAVAKARNIVGGGKDIADSYLENMRKYGGRKKAAIGIDTTDNENITKEIVLPEFNFIYSKQRNEPIGSYLNYTGEETITPTRKQYVNSKRDVVRLNAADAMLNTTIPTIPTLPNTNIASKIAGRLGVSDENRMKIFGRDHYPQTCIATATSKFGNKYYVPGNKTFYNNPEQYGFTEIDKNIAKKGDLVQMITMDSNDPHHMTMITGDNKDIVSYSSGGHYPDNIRLNKNIELFPHDNKKYYRFIGTKDDNNKWNEEYRKKYKKTMGGKSNKYTTKLNSKDEKEFQKWYSKVSKYKNINPNPDDINQQYDYRGYWRDNKKDANNIIKGDPNAHFTDKYKQPGHPTFSTESKYADRINTAGTWNGNIFVHSIRQMSNIDKIHNYLIDTGEGYFDGKKDVFPKSKKSMGGLSHSKDYGSKSKPYPSFNKKDFAGEHRSYPIPTKADAVDALRLTGLHGHSDVRAKVYSKYPELRKKSKAGGVYSITSNGKTMLRMIPSTGKFASVTSDSNRSKAAVGTKKKVSTIKAEKYDDINPTQKVDYTIPTISFPDINYGERFTANGEVTKRNWLSKTMNVLGNIGNWSVNNAETLTGLSSNIISNIIGNRINNRTLDKMTYNIPDWQTVEYNAKPILTTPTSLKTNYDISARLRQLNEGQRKFEKDVDAGTSSSQVAIARKQANRMNTILAKNQLYEDKENKETALINEDRRNSQEVEARNAERLNNYYDKKATFDAAQLDAKQRYYTSQYLAKQQFENNLLEQRAENKINTIQNINAGVQDVLNKIDRNRNEKQTIAAMVLAHPNLPIETLYAQGLVNKATYDAYRKAYKLNK